MLLTVPIKQAASGPARAWRRHHQRDESGAVSMEFAILAVPFFILLLGVMEVGYDLFVQAALDSAVETAARSIQVGTTVGSSNMTNSQIVAAAVCPAIATVLNCNNIYVSVQPVTTGDYYSGSVNELTALSPSNIAAANASGGGDICTGTGYQLMQLNAWYVGPTFLGTLVPSFSISNPVGSGRVHITASSAGFVNEDFTGGQTTGSACGNGT
jgi:Flp pilus assembly protein TadG